jgi:hypothetical protein
MPCKLAGWLAYAFLTLSAAVTQPAEARQRGTASWHGNADAATVATSYIAAPSTDTPR